MIYLYHNVQFSADMVARLLSKVAFLRVCCVFLLYDVLSLVVQDAMVARLHTVKSSALWLFGDFMSCRNFSFACISQEFVDAGSYSGLSCVVCIISKHPLKRGWPSFCYYVYPISIILKGRLVVHYKKRSWAAAFSSILFVPSNPLDNIARYRYWLSLKRCL